jgi:ERCC4-type nuclease
MDIIVDTREQKPLFKGAGIINFKLLVGDYSTLKLRNSFCVERKSLQDLYGTITKGHIRFRHEHLRALANNIELVLVIEGTKKAFTEKRFPGGLDRNIKGETLGKIIDSIEHRWKLKVVWCKNRAEAKHLITEYLTKEEKKLANKNRIVKPQTKTSYGKTV